MDKNQKFKDFKKRQKELHKQREVDPSDFVDVSLKRPYAEIEDRLENIIAKLTGEARWVYDDSIRYKMQRKYDRERQQQTDKYLQSLRVKSERAIIHIE